MPIKKYRGSMGIIAPRLSSYGTPPMQTILGGLSSYPQSLSYISQLPQWYYVERRFSRLLKNLDATALQLIDYRTKVRELLQTLNNHYWPYRGADEITCIIGGSWGSGTPTRPGSDIDLIFLLPWEMKSRFDNRVGNIQSQILQDVKNVLMPSYPTTQIKGDGPTVVVEFSTIKIEVAPVFRYYNTPIANESLLVEVCHTNNGGGYKPSAPMAEGAQIVRMNAETNGYLCALIRMAKAWKRECNVPIKSIALQHMAISFLKIWPYSKNGYFWADWMVCSFFEYMLTQQNKFAVLPGSYETIQFGNEWVSKAQSALRASLNACTYEEQNNNALAGEEWQKVFGVFIPKEA